MKPYPLLFAPALQPRVWGGSRLKKLFNNTSIPGPIGESWIISDHPAGKSIIDNGALAGKTIGDLMHLHPSWLSGGEMLKKFPLLVKLIDSNDHLSVQVHPGDDYAMAYESNETGKTECWYILDCEPGAEIVLGHTAGSREEFINLFNNNKWDELLVRVPVKPGDFFFIPSGMVHALGKGILLLEIQQNSDVTYRLYDYDRVGLDGRKRELHIQKAIDVIDFSGAGKGIKHYMIREGNLNKTILASCNYFHVEKWCIEGVYDAGTRGSFMLAYVLAGKGGELLCAGNSLALARGISFMIPANLSDFQVTGDVEMVVSYMHKPPRSKEAPMYTAG